jgi:hypothetical protein
VKYEDYASYILRMKDKAEPSVLWPGKVEFFSRSSGTTNDVSKYIPVSSESLNKNNYQAGRDLYTLTFMQYPELQIFNNRGSVLGITGSLTQQDNGITVGDISAIIASQLPLTFQNMRKPSLKTTLMPQWNNKIPAIIDETLNENITHLSGVPTWFVSIFEEIKKVQPYETLRDIWPNLELFIHGAVAFEPYRNIFQKLLPFDDMRYVEVYNATEGFFAVQDNSSLSGEMLLLTNHGVFYEFIPFDEYQEGNMEAVCIDDVELGVDYAMIITTNAGLWRYDIGDVVEFTSTKPYRIKISGRTTAFINLCGEELMVGNTDEAVAKVSREYDISVAHYTVAPIFVNEEGKGAHQWLVELESGSVGESELALRLDTILQELNSDYQAKREADIALQPLDVTVVPEGTFMKWLEQKGKLGGQHKVPKLVSHRTIIEEILGYSSGS